jgi:hypothetical protein
MQSAQMAALAPAIKRPASISRRPQKAQRSAPPPGPADEDGFAVDAGGLDMAVILNLSSAGVQINAALGCRIHAAFMLHALLQQKLQHDRRLRVAGRDPLDIAGRVGNCGKRWIFST